MDKKRLIIGMSGASGAPITIALLKQLKRFEAIETHLIVTKGARLTLAQETSCTEKEVEALADIVYDNDNIGAATASGSFWTEGMIVVPCSMKTLAGIVSGYSENLLLRSADAVLKERRRLVLVTRECPLGTLHLRNMYEASQLGAVILPPVLSFYNHPQSLEDNIAHICGKILDQFGLEAVDYQRWEGMETNGKF